MHATDRLLTTLSYYTLLTTLISIRRMTPDGCEILALTQAGVGVSIAHGEILALTQVLSLYGR